MALVAQYLRTLQTERFFFSSDLVLVTAVYMFIVLKRSNIVLGLFRAGSVFFVVVFFFLMSSAGEGA